MSLRIQNDFDPIVHANNFPCKNNAGGNCELAYLRHPLS